MGDGEQGALEDAVGSEAAAAVQAQLVALMQGLAEHGPPGADEDEDAEVHLELGSLHGEEGEGEEEQEGEEEGEGAGCFQGTIG